MIRDIRYEEIPFYGLFLSSLKLVFLGLGGRKRRPLKFFVPLSGLFNFSNIFSARNPQLTPKIKDESEIEEIYNIKEELGRGTFGVVNRAEKDGKERMTFMTSSDL